MSMSKHNNFGMFFKKNRIDLGLTLRQFCQEKGLDAGNISKLERGLLPPPQSREKLEEYARHLKLKKGSDDWYQFFDLAAVETGHLPDEIRFQKDIIKELPLLFRTLRGQKIPDEKLEKLIEKIRKGE